MATRTLSLVPKTSENLDRFLARYNRLGKYLLMPAFLDNPSQPATLHSEHAILKTDLAVREAWEIGRDDTDMFAIFADDSPVLPDGGAPAPVLELIDWKRSREKS